MDEIWRPQLVSETGRPQALLIVPEHAQLTLEIHLVFLKYEMLSPDECEVALHLLKKAGGERNWAMAGLFFNGLGHDLQMRWLKHQGHIGKVVCDALLLNPDQLLNLEVIGNFINGRKRIGQYKAVLPLLEGFDKCSDKLRELSNWFQCDGAGPAILAMSKSPAKLRYK